MVHRDVCCGPGAGRMVDARGEERCDAGRMLLGPGPADRVPRPVQVQLRQSDGKEPRQPPQFPSLHLIPPLRSAWVDVPGSEPNSIAAGDR